MTVILFTVKVKLTLSQRKGLQSPLLHLKELCIFSLPPAKICKDTTHEIHQIQVHVYITSKGAEKGKAKQQQHNRKAKQNNTTHPKQSFFKEKVGASGISTFQVN